MKKTYKILLLIVFSLICFNLFACKSVEESNDIVTQETETYNNTITEEEEFINHTRKWVSYALMPYNARYFYRDATYDIKYPYTVSMKFDDYDEYQDFILNVLKEDYYFFEIPGLNNEKFEYVDIYYTYKVTEEIIEDYFGGITDNTECFYILKDNNFDLITGYGYFSYRIRYRTYNDDGSIDDDYLIYYSAYVGSEKYKELQKTQAETGLWFDIYDMDHYKIDEIRYIEGYLYYPDSFHECITISNGEVNGEVIYITNYSKKCKSLLSWDNFDSIEEYNIAYENMKKYYDEFYDWVYDIIIEGGFIPRSKITE